MNMSQAVTSVFTKYVTFSGRAPRSEYWWWVLAYLIVLAVLTYVDLHVLGSGDMQSTMAEGEVGISLNLGVLSAIWVVVNLLPGLAVTIRRLHDKDKSGWWVLISFVPLIGTILLLVWFASKGTTGANRFGPDPLA